MNKPHTYTCRYLSPLGSLTMLSGGSALTALAFEGQRHFQLPSSAQEESSLPVFRQTAQWLDAYFSGQTLPPAPPLQPSGTPFRLAVWAQLQRIPYGQTCTYQELAQRLRQTQGEQCSACARAVGGAAGHNPISILIPCHRLIGSQGKLTGYAGGLHRKQQLLAWEQHGTRPQPLV